MGFSAALLVGGALAGAAASGAFADKPKPVEPPKPMPVPTTGVDATTARRNAIRQQMARRGRASTILTGEDEKLGG